MKKNPLLFGLLLGCSALAAQAVIKGVVFKSLSCNENALEPLPGVQVSADGASSVYSLDDGTFRLQFPNKKPGAATRIWVRKEGYVFLNEKGYEDFILFSDPNRGIILILCTTGAYSRSAPAPAEYTKILQEVSSLKKNLAEINNSIIEKLDEALKIDSLLAEEPLSLGRDKFEKNEDILLSQIGLNYQDFASYCAKNKDFSSALGYYEEAEDVFNKLNGKNRLEEYQNTLGEIQLEKAQLYMQLKQYDDAENAANIARQIFVDLKDYGRNRAAYQGMLAEIENAVGALNLAKEDYYRALQNYNRARSYYQDLRKTEPETYRLKELETMATIGEIHLLSDNSIAAQQQLEAVIDSVEAAGATPLEYRQQYQAVKANAYMNLGYLFFSLNPERSIANFEEAERQYLELSQEAPERYLPTLLIIYLNIGHLYYNGENLTGAKEKYEQVLGHFNGNNHRTSTAMLHVYIGANSAIGNIYFTTYNYEQAARHYEACIAEKELLSVAGILDKAEFLKQAGLSNLNDVDRDVKLKGEHQLEEARDIARSQSGDSRAQQMLQEICGYIECY
ncbi:MAG: hypothetical protein H6557_09335 [Lewinellaceae bacterium]|nr:hypothetical protein [Phaeodactylibacter sp.]MCB9036808.1 hypothetical protein [Lewinellaceae bacterium]